MTWNPQGEDARRYAVECGGAIALKARFPLPEAAALWCAVPPEQIRLILGTASEVARGIYRHSEIPCLEDKCRLLHEAIDAGELPVCRETGGRVGDYVKPERRHIMRNDLKAWIAANHPSQRPPSLFDEIESAAHPAITTDAYNAMKADRDAARAQLEQANKWWKEHQPQFEALQAERDELRATVERLTADNAEIDQRTETALLNIIGALLALLLGKSASGERNSVFTTQAAIIGAILHRFEGRYGISERNLQDKLPKARKSLEASD